MQKRRFLTAWLAAFAAMMVLGGLWHFAVFRDFYASSTLPASLRWHTHLPSLALAELGRWFVLAYLFPLVARGSGIWQDGLRLGALAAAFGIFAWMALVYTVTAQAPVSWLLLEACFLVCQGVAGSMIVSACYGNHWALDPTSPWKREKA